MTNRWDDWMIDVTDPYFFEIHWKYHQESHGDRISEMIFSQ
jgi:hypothetical protein